MLIELFSISVVGINDRSPVFESPEYTAWIFQDAPRGQIVAKITAFDPDGDKLRYSIVGQTKTAFSIQSETGLVTVSQPRILRSEMKFILNVSVSDGVFTVFARLNVSFSFLNEKCSICSLLSVVVYSETLNFSR